MQSPNKKKRMSCQASTYTYADPGFRRQLYDSVAERNHIFGYDATELPRVQRNYHDTYVCDPYKSCCANNRSCDVCTAPKDYYFDLNVDPCQKAVIGFTKFTPNLYDDVVLPGGKPTIEKPNLYRSWEPFSTTATPILKGCYTKWIPHKPVEIAPRRDPNYWVADLNARLYERSLVGSAKENPYANFYRRQGLINLLAQNMPPRNDPYTKVIASGQDSFACQLQQNSGIGPATTSF